MWNLRCWFTKNQKKNNAGTAERMHKMLLKRTWLRHLKMKNSTFESNISQLTLIANIRTYRFSS